LLHPNKKIEKRLVTFFHVYFNHSSIFDFKMSDLHTKFTQLLAYAGFQYKSYQYEGLEWCVEREKQNNPKDINNPKVRGGFIADEMGLGKTLLMIATMYCHYLPSTLIVVPPILLQQWYDEIYKATGHRALCFYGPEKKAIGLSQLSKAPIVLTTYNSLLGSDCVLKKKAWSRVIFDEAHHLRNRRTRRFRSCKQLRAGIRWLVTGTPIQNKKQDFYCLCDALGFVPSFYAGDGNFELIGRDYLLRRTKAMVNIELPTLTKKDCLVEWSNVKEMMLSEEIHALLPGQFGVSSDKRKQMAETLDNGGPLVAILRARQSCIFPKLMKDHVIKFCTDDYVEALDHCSKIDAVVNLIAERKDNGRGKIVFCHYKEEIDIIKKRLLEVGLEKVVCYDGRSSKLAKSLLAEPADALIIQIQTGCEGLNLQKHFSEIYFVSPHWNPSIEDQAVARCHRIGQEKEVDVFKFEMKGFKSVDDSDSDPITLEKYVNKVQELKREISNQLLNC